MKRRVELPIDIDYMGYDLVDFNKALIKLGILKIENDLYLYKEGKIIIDIVGFEIK